MARVPLRETDELPAEYRYLFEENDLGVLNLFRALGNNPRLLQAYMRWGTALWRESGLDTRAVELVILAVAGALDADYEWHQHVAAGRDAGLTEGDLAALRDGSFDNLAPADRVLARYAVEVVDGQVRGETSRAMAEQFDVGTVVGVTLLASHYLLTDRVVTALAIEPEGPFVGWSLDDA